MDADRLAGLDPQARALLDVFARRPSAVPPPDDAAWITALRERMRTGIPLAGPAEAVAQVQDREIAGLGGLLPLRLYRPRAGRPTPLLVWCHGGGFVAGDLDTHDRPLRAIANRAGCAVLAVGYRLAPEHAFPAAIEDAYAALAWAAAHAAEAGADPAWLAVGGDSAGGAIAAAACMLARQRGGPVIALQTLLYPDGDARGGLRTPSWRAHDGCILERTSKDRTLAMYLPPWIDRTQPLVSPALAEPPVLRGLPPALIVTAEFDPQRDEGEQYAARLRAAGVPVTLTRTQGMIHGFFQMAGRLDAGRRVIERVAAAVAALEDRE